MGTNYYLFCKDRKSVKEHFDGEYELVDVPDLGYMIHLNKLSCGWLPLFQKHEAFSTFRGLIGFIYDHLEYEIYDEYGNWYSVAGYMKKIIDHCQQEKRALKWKLEKSPFSGREMIQLTDCDMSEADIFAPFRHSEYSKSYSAACKRYNTAERGYVIDNSSEYTPDPEYQLDWIAGEFS